MTDKTNPSDVENTETARLEAFSDGVFAIAITLLILDIKVPRDLPAGTTLLSALFQQWPAYIAYLLSFAIIGIMWINHHRMFQLIQRSDHWFMVLNVLLLLGISILPFPTAVLADYLLTPDQNVAAVLYAGTSLIIALVFNAMWWYAAKDMRLLDRSRHQSWADAITKQYSFGPIMYLIAFVLAFFSVAASVGLTIVMAIFFLMPPSRISPVTNKE